MQMCTCEMSVIYRLGGLVTILIFTKWSESTIWITSPCAWSELLSVLLPAVRRCCLWSYTPPPPPPVKVSSYIAHYPVFRTVQSALHFTSLTDLFTRTPSRLLWEASSHMLQLIREGCSYTYPPVSIARYSCIQLSELEQCRVKETCPRF